MTHLLSAALLLLPFIASAIASAQADRSGLRTSIADALVVPTEQRFIRYHWDREPGIIALYFGADWCGPCHALVPELKRIRAALQDVGADTEVVYVSLDESAGQMRRYMRLQQMPWPAIDYRRLRAMPAVKARAGMAPPNLVLIDREGNVLASGWQGRRYLGIKPVLETWIATVAAQASSTPVSPLDPTSMEIPR